MAGNCTYNATDNFDLCDGAFFQAAASGVAVSPYDLTRVRGESIPASVTAQGAIMAGADVSSIYNVDPIDVNVDEVGPASAIGLYGLGDHQSYLTNADTGTITVTAHSVDDVSVAMGAYSVGLDFASLNNYGAITATASSDNGDASAYAASVYGSFVGIGVLVNGGDLEANATAGTGGVAMATAAYTLADVATVINDGTAVATAVSDGGGAIATGLKSGVAPGQGFGVYAAYAAAYNYGDVTATATADGGVALATGVYALGYLGATTENEGNVSVSAVGNDALATGMYSAGLTYGAYSTNTGSIDVLADGHDVANAVGIVNVATLYGVAITNNAGDINVVASSAYEATATGVENFTFLYDSIIENSGTISVTANANGLAGDPNNYGYGYIAGYSTTIAVHATNIIGYGYGVASITNSETGVINATATMEYGYAVAVGALSESVGPYGLGVSTVVNDGLIHVTTTNDIGGSTGFGAAAVSNSFYGVASVENYGTIQVDASTRRGIAYATGAYTRSVAGASSVINHGDIVAYASTDEMATAVAAGVRSMDFSVYYPAANGSVDVINEGSIVASTLMHESGFSYSYGVQTSFAKYSNVENAEGASILAHAYNTSYGRAVAFGLQTKASYGNTVTNDGDITAYSFARAYQGHYGATRSVGIYSAAFYGADATIVNNGDVTAIGITEDAIYFVTGGASATGIHARTGGDSSVQNTGTITAYATSSAGIVGSNGIIAGSAGDIDIRNEAGAAIVSYAATATIAATDPNTIYDANHTGGIAAAWGVRAYSNGASYANVYNAGTIETHAVVTPSAQGEYNYYAASALAGGIYLINVNESGSISNVGDVDVSATADYGYATAYGTWIHNFGEALADNSGAITVRAQANDGNAFAVGSYVYARDTDYNCDQYSCSEVVVGGDAAISNAGDVHVATVANGGVGYGYGLVSLAAYATSIDNSGDVGVNVTADDARAIGGFVSSFYADGVMQNSGGIAVVANGTTAANATGAYLSAVYSTELANDGTIQAGAYGADSNATAVTMNSLGTNTLANTGTIGAYGDGVRNAIVSSTDAIAMISNAGSITGGVTTGNLDDLFDNADGATWNAVGESNFGDGDDQILNAGTIVMRDAAIRLGGYANGNTFDNSGTLGVIGTNVVDGMGPNAFANNGTISFLDGMANGSLTIVGDFAGEGAINVDVSGLAGTSDRLYIDGMVLDATAQTVNVNFVDLPMVRAPGTRIEVVSMTDSEGVPAEQFVLGSVTGLQNRGFLSLDWRLNADQQDVWLGIEANGLNDAGRLASVFAPSVQRMADAQVGTWRQRMGVVPERGGEHGLAPWLRVFSDSGDVSPEHQSTFGPSERLDFHQSVQGWEVGIDAQPSEQMSVGLLFGTSDGTQRLEHGFGSTRIDGKTFGLYGTWRPNAGQYLDVSQRWMGFDSRVQSIAGELTPDASASVFNIEAGLYTWKLANVNVQPQVQYTRSRVSDISTLENANATFDDDGGLSSRARIGVGFDSVIERSGFTWTPYGSLNAVREFDGEYSHAINDVLLGTTSTDGTSAMLELGIGGRKDRLSFSGGINWTDGGALNGVFGGQVTMRYSW